MKRIIGVALTAALAATACKDEAAPPLYEPVAVARRDITVAVEAAGTVAIARRSRGSAAGGFARCWLACRSTTPMPGRGCL